jgi:methylated-DNA-[protein]-cysteine S-methyltransferase
MSQYQLVETAFGYAALAFSIAPFRLLEVRLPRDNPDAVCHEFDARHWTMDNRQPSAREIGCLLARYFEGHPVDAPWPVMDLSGFTSSQQAVYRAVSSIPYGHTAAYGQVARMAGHPRAARFVGTTMANNPYPVFIPCHRVIKSDGSIGGFGGGRIGVDLKRRMLALETAPCENPVASL